MALTIARGNQISFYDLNIAAGLSGTTANTSMAARGTTFGISYTTNGSDSLQMCEFYTDGCEGAPPTLYEMELYFGPNSTVACDFLSESGFFYVDTVDFIDTTKIYTDAAGTIYADSQYYAFIFDGIWKQWSSSGNVIGSGFC